MAVVLRSDIPVAPGTATPTSSTLTTASTATVSLTFYRDYRDVPPARTVDLATVSLSLTKRSLVVAVAVLMQVYADTADVVDLILVIGGAEVALQKLKSDPIAPYALHGYRALERGDHTVVLRLRNNDKDYYHWVYYYGALDTAGNKVVGYLVVYTIPLE